MKVAPWSGNASEAYIVLVLDCSFVLFLSSCHLQLRFF